jgi:hypothetical protein
VAEGRESPEDAARALEMLRWLERVAYHLWRLSVHLRGQRNLAGGHDENANNPVAA